MPGGGGGLFGGCRAPKDSKDNRQRTASFQEAFVGPFYPFNDRFWKL